MAAKRVVKRGAYTVAFGERTAYIGRSGPGASPLGNPFVIGRDGDRNAVISKYREWLKAQLALANDEGWQGSRTVIRAFADLRDVDVLVCHCAPLACHGDVLIEMLEKERTP